MCKVSCCILGCVTLVHYKECFHRSRPGLCCQQSLAFWRGPNRASVISGTSLPFSVPRSLACLMARFRLGSQFVIITAEVLSFEPLWPGLEQYPSYGSSSTLVLEPPRESPLQEPSGCSQIIWRARTGRYPLTSFSCNTKSIEELRQRQVGP